MQILVLNCGSSSVKFALLDAATEEEQVRGVAENLDASHPPRLRWRDGGGQHSRALEAADHQTALNEICALLRSDREQWHAINAVGHRVVHGGEAFTRSALIDVSVVERIAALSPLAPLHNPLNLLGIHTLREALPALPHVAVFDTAFHQTLPPRAFHYALPQKLYRELGVRRYGFHGSSHAYVAHEAIRRLDLDLAESAVITAHLGNGCSATAVDGGRSVDTSMGLSPLEGLVMGTRSGDVDPGLHELLARRLGLDISGTTDLLNRESGLLGVSGLSNDMRTLWQRAESGDEDAGLAVELFCYRLAKYVSALVVPLGRLDALVFTGGIGENAAGIRERVLALLGHLGMRVDAERNAKHGEGSKGVISDAGPPVALVIASDEELLIARETAAELAQSPAP